MYKKEKFGTKYFRRKGGITMILGIYGTSGMGRELREIALHINEIESRWSEIIFIDDTKEEGLFKECKRMSFEKLKENYTPNEIEIVIGMGEPAYKQLVCNRVKAAGYNLATLIHPDAEVVPSAQLGEGVVVRKGTIVSSDSIVGNNVILQSYVVIGHDTVIGDHCQISSFTDVAGNCNVGKCVFIGLGSVIKEKTQIGNDAIVSMGAVVMKNVGIEEVVMGNPARTIAKNEKKKVFN